MSEPDLVRLAATQAEGTDYELNVFLRAASMIEEAWRDKPDGYYRHWNLVDAELLRRHAAKLRAAREAR